MTDEKECYGLIMLKRIYDSDFQGEKISLVSEKSNQKFPIDCIVLAAASKYFAAALGPNFQESNKSEFILDDTDGQTVKAIVNFCYTGHIELTEENVKTFLTIASSVQLDLLEEKCRRFYNDNLNVKNTVETLAIADRYSYVDLRQRAFDIACGNFEFLPTTNIQEMNHRLLQELLKCDGINATEDLVFKRLLEWCQNKEDERRQHMPELLKQIRLEHISLKFLQDTVVTVYETFDCSKLVSAEYKRRSSSQCSTIDVRRFHSIFCFFQQIKGYNVADSSTIQIAKYNKVLKGFEHTAEITLDNGRVISAVFQNNKLYVLNGRNDRIYLNLTSYDLISHEKKMLPEMKKSRSFCTAIVFGKYIYVFGGFDGINTVNSCERFDPDKIEWKEIKSMNSARYWNSAAVLNGYIYVAGGIIGDRASASVELYDPKCDEWLKIKPMNKARYQFTLVESNGFLYAMGGEVEIMEKYDPSKNCWTNIGSFNVSRRITSGINDNGQIFVVTCVGNFGEIKINECDKNPFISLAKLDYNPIGYRLYRN